MNSRLQNGPENAMPIRIGYLLPTRERIMAGQPQAAPLLELAERAEASAYHFDVLLGERHPLLAAEQRQQDQHALVRPLTGIESEVPLQRPGQDTHAIARIEPRGLRQLHQPAPLP